MIVGSNQFSPGQRLNVIGQLPLVDKALAFTFKSGQGAKRNRADVDFESEAEL